MDNLHTPDGQVIPQSLVEQVAEQLSSRVLDRVKQELLRPTFVQQTQDNGRKPSLVKAWVKEVLGFGVSSEEKDILKAAGNIDGNGVLSVPFNLSGQLTSAGLGAHVIPTEIGKVFVEQLGAWANLYNRVTRYETATGTNLRLPYLDDTAKEAQLLPATGVGMDTSVSPTVGSLALGVYTAVSKPVVISFGLIRDAGFNLEQLIGRILGERIGRLVDQIMVAGTGPQGSQPTGMINAVGSVETAETGKVAYDDLVSVVAAVDPAYKPNAVWVMSPSTYGVVQKLKDTTNRPIFEYIPTSDFPKTILGYPVIENRNMPALQAGNTAILFGDLSVYVIREVGTLRLSILKERYVEFDCIGFLAFYDFDCGLQAPSTTGALKTLSVKTGS